MDKVKSYTIPNDSSCVVEDPMAVRVSPNADIDTLRHNLIDAAYATNDHETIYNSLLVLLHTTHTSATPLKDKMQKRLEELALLSDGWDGDGSLRINEDVIDFVRRIIQLANEQDLENWVLFPDARGYLYLDFTQGNNIAGMTIAAHKIVAFVKKDGRLSKYSYDKLSEEKVVKILEKAHE